MLSDPFLKFLWLPSASHPLQSVYILFLCIQDSELILLRIRIFFFFFLAMLCSLWDLSSPTRDIYFLCHKAGFPPVCVSMENPIIRLCICLPMQCKRCSFNPWVGRSPQRRAWLPTPVFLAQRTPWTEQPGRLQSIALQSQIQLKCLSINHEFCIQNCKLPHHEIM